MNKSNENRVTIVVINYNQTEYIDNCLTSILEQTYKHIDIHLIDNNSIEKPFSQIQKFSTLFEEKNIKLTSTLNDKNIGLSAALNQGINSSKSEFIAFIAADDMMLPDRIEYQVNFLKKNNNLLCCAGGQIKIDHTGKILKKQNNKINKFEIKNKDNIFEKTNNIYSPTATYRTELLKNLDCFDVEIPVEDITLFYKAAAMGFEMAVIPKFFSKYRIHNNNSHSKHEWMHQSKLQILEKHKNQPHYNKLKKLIYLEGFYSLSKTNKKLAIELLPEVIKYFYSPYFIAGIVFLLSRKVRATN